MVPRVDFDIVDSILRVLEGWGLGNKGLYRKYRAYKKIIKIAKSYFGPGNPKKTIFAIFPYIFFTKKWAGNLGITSETTWESRVRRPFCTIRTKPKRVVLRREHPKVLVGLRSDLRISSETT